MKKSKLNLLFVTPVSINYPGGAERWLYEVSTRLIKRGHDVGILYTDWTPEKISVNDSDFFSNFFKDVKLYKCGFIKPPFRGMALVDIFSSREIVNECDLSYILAYPPNELQVRFLRKFIRKGLVAGIHSFLNLESDFIHRMYLPLYLFGMRSFDAIHVLNKRMLDFFRKSGFENVFLIPNGVDAKEYELCYPPWDSETFTVLFSGRLTYDKGADILTNIIRYAKTSLDQEIKFLIIGTGPLKKQIEEVAKESRNVEYLGYVSKDLLKEVYRRAHILLVPSRSEGMPLSVLEAQACGLPVVGSRIPGIIDIVEDGSSGRLVTVKDVGGFVMALKEYYMLWKEFPEKYYEMNKKIREKTIKQYDWEQVMDKIEELFIKISLGY